MGRPQPDDYERVVNPAVHQIIALIEERWPTLVDSTVKAIFQQVPAYRLSADPALRDDLTMHVEVIFKVLVVSLREDRLAVREDFPTTRQQAHRRLEQGIGLSDFLQAFRIGQLHLWNGILDAVGDDPEVRETALRSVDKLMHMIEVGSTVAAEGYLEAQQHQLADQDRRVRDLLEDLIRGDDVSSAVQQSMLRSSGLDRAPGVLMLSAIAVGSRSDERNFRLALTAVRAGRVHGVEGMAASRRDEIVGLMPVPAEGPEKAVAALEQAVQGLERVGAHLSVGVSTVRGGLAEVPMAYAEAVAARSALRGRPGYLALTRLSTFDYLVLREDETARRLIRPELRRFVEEDLLRGGDLVATLQEYAACDLNAKTVAERLHMHVNTVYYRLGRVAERTSLDLRKFADVMELVIAIRMLRGHLDDAVTRPLSPPLSSVH